MGKFEIESENVPDEQFFNDYEFDNYEIPDDYEVVNFELNSPDIEAFEGIASSSSVSENNSYAASYSSDSSYYDEIGNHNSSSEEFSEKFIVNKLMNSDTNLDFSLPNIEDGKNKITIFFRKNIFYKISNEFLPWFQRIFSTYFLKVFTQRQN